MRIFLILAVSLSLAGCAAPPPEPAADGPAAQVWWSAELLPENPRWYTDPPPESEIRHRLDRRPDLAFGPVDDGAPGTVFRVDPQEIHQTMRGIGTSLEGTTIYAIRKGNDAAGVRDLLRTLVDPETGLGFSLFRITIGTSDFSDGRSVSDHPQGYYTYRDREDAPFSIQNDIDLGIVETLRMTQTVADEVGEDIRFFASCWSPPPWMKTSGALIGGTLRPGYAPELARYFRRFVEAYTAEGIPIYAMTMQNEPNFVPDTYPGMRLSWQQEKDLVVATYDEFHPDDGRPALDVRLWINDHNFEDWVNADSILTALEAEGRKHVVDAVAFHNYTDAPAANMTRLRERHPGTSVVFTEHAEWGTAGMHNLQQYFWNGAETYAYWVTFTTRDLDEHNQGPYNRIGELSPTLMIRDDGPLGWYRTPEYYLLGQFSRFIRPGAVRIGVDRGTPETLTAVAFRNPDGRIVVVLVNQTNAEQPFRLHHDGREAAGVQPHGTVGTYVWRDML